MRIFQKPSNEKKKKVSEKRNPNNIEIALMEGQTSLKKKNGLIEVEEIIWK